MTFALVLALDYCDESLFEGHVLSCNSSLPVLGPPGYGPTEEAFAQTPACQCADWSDGGEHVLYHIAAQALHNGP